MSLLLKRVELSNIRTHRFIVFEPELEGVTAIAGPNGGGKSTLVDSIAWSLFGTKPAGVSRVSSLMREGTEIPQDKVYARVTLLMDQTELLVERRMVTKAGAVECEVWERQPGEDEFVSMAGPAVSHSEAYLRRRLKMDERGFLAAVLVQQKQVDQLISSGPRERAEVIERLTGIASITRGLQEARQSHNAMKKGLAMTSLDEDAIPRLQQALEDGATKQEQQQERLATLQAQLEESNAKKQELSEALEEQERRAAERESLLTQEATLQARLESLEEESARLLQEKDEYKERLTPRTVGSSAEELRATVAKRSSMLNGLMKQEYALEVKCRETQQQLETFLKVQEKSGGLTTAQAQERLAELRGSRETLAEKRRETQEIQANAQAGVRRLTKSLKDLKQGDGECPTCLRPLEEGGDVLAHLQEELEGHKAQLQEAKDTLEKLSEEDAKLQRREASHEKLLQALQSMGELEGTLEEATKAREAFGPQIKVARTELEAVEQLLQEAQELESVKRSYDQLLKRVVKLSDNREKLQGELQGVQKALAGVSATGTSEKSLGSLRERYMRAEGKSQKLFEAYRDIREEHRMLQAELVHVGERLQDAEREAERYAELMASVENSGKAVEVLEEFYEDRLKNSVPVVSLYASDLLSRFTEGRFTQLTLDKKFSASVTMATGAERPVGLLSGGELSLAAISLRLAISMLLNSGASQNVIILDEVLVSQDAQRSEQILNTIKDVCQGQVIMISHGPNTADIADNVFEL